MNQESHEIMEACLALKERDKQVLAVSKSLDVRSLLSIIVTLAQKGINIRLHKSSTQLEVKCLTRRIQ